ncbi:sensor histidine kinase [Streptomyces minutiscleroticus]|uniref:histidine kinase n=1 Tax=Streptomyces minutiscleroticus TaxID=68238 RepID=A0A918U2U3_9ACTN|nr:histidine kinase [Streptomyces minutiscleroticus]GGX85553.1 two-component sensor histidine kinase [Streptomyces minutiscleroticus]
MPGILSPLTRAVTYTRWLHLLVGSVVPFVCAMVYPGLVDPSLADWALIAVLPVPLALAAAAVPGTRRAEGLQARLMLFPGAHARVKGDEDPGVSATPSASWSDRGRTAVWMVLRLEAGLAVALVSGQLMALSLTLTGAAVGDPGPTAPLLRSAEPGWAYALLAPVPVLVLLMIVAGAGALMARAARRLLGPSAKERLAVLEERTERLLERNRIARELHDSIGHALTLAVVQAGAARAAGSPDFTDRALRAIEETGRAALEDLERVLVVLRETSRPAGTRPGLAEADRLLDSARSSGAEVDAEVSGALEHVPGPVSREGYRILQEALTNVLRHAGPVPVRVRVAVEEARLRLEVRNPLAAGAPPAGAGLGSGLRGIRERAALLGGDARAGRDDGQWLLRVDLPLR